MSNLITKNLSKSFNGTRVINNVSFEVNQGEFCILLGPSGCGKTTALRLIAGLEQQDEGEIFIGDREVSNLSPRERDIAMVFQSYALYPHMSVFENMAFSLKMQKRPGQEIDKKVRATAELLELNNFLHRKPKELSGGQRQRVAIGRAIVRDPKLFLFDEPLSNLDAKLRVAMREELARLHQQLKSTTVYVTHDQVEAMTLGEKIILFNQGQIQQVGTPNDVYNRPSNLFAATFIGTPQMNLLEGHLETSEGKLFFKSFGVILNLKMKDELIKYAHQELTLGIRPESLTPEKGGPVKGKLELIEHLGPETVLYVRVGKQRLIAKSYGDVRLKKGEDISLALHERGIHFFQNGQRINLK